MVGNDRWKSGENLTDWIIDDLIKVGMVKDRSKVVDVQIERIPHSYQFETTLPNREDA